jgi:hypothetical protein
MLPVLSARLEMIGDGSTAGREHPLEGYAGLESRIFLGSAYNSLRVVTETIGRCDHDE